MIRRIITIDRDKCTGCALCVTACHEGAIGLEDGTAKLLRDDYCDGLGDCLPACPAGAITFEEREALAYDEAAVQENMRRKNEPGQPLADGALPPLGNGPTPLSGQKPLSDIKPTPFPGQMGASGNSLMPLSGRMAPPPASSSNSSSHLAQWPVQIKLAPTQAPYFQGADLLVAADCTAYALADFHERFMKGKITLIGCPKLDEGDYAKKLSEIIAANQINSLTLVRMSVPCCGGLERALAQAVHDSGKNLPPRLAVVSPSGQTLWE